MEPDHKAKYGSPVRAPCCTRNIFKKHCAFREIDTFTCFGAVLYEGSVEGARTPRQLSQKAQGTDYLLYAFWKVGFTARPPDIGSVCCIPIFQVSNRTIGCILDMFGGCWEDIV